MLLRNYSLVNDMVLNIIRINVNYLQLFPKKRIGGFIPTRIPTVHVLN